MLKRVADCTIEPKKASVAETTEDQLPDVDENSVGALSDEV
jgi:import receptor subunit TOM70